MAIFDRHDSIAAAFGHKRSKRESLSRQFTEKSEWSPDTGVGLLYFHADEQCKWLESGLNLCRRTNVVRNVGNAIDEDATFGAKFRFCDHLPFHPCLPSFLGRNGRNDSFKLPAATLLSGFPSTISLISIPYVHKTPP
jgi:hypothetical protein